MNLSIVDWFGYNLSPQGRMRVIKDAGFSGVMLLWADYFDKDYKLFPEYARKAGLYIDNTHAPYVNANNRRYSQAIKRKYCCGKYEPPGLSGAHFSGHSTLRLGFCFDSRHCNVFTPDVDFLSLYGDKLMALHLHENNGVERLAFFTLFQVILSGVILDES